MDLVEQLNHIFYPRTIAVVGVSSDPKKIGAMCLRSLLDGGFKGKIYGVNPNLTELWGLKLYPSVSSIPDDVDLAIVVIPAEQTVPVVEECASKGVKGTIMLSSGFKELGSKAGLNLEDKIRDIANRAGMKIVGPNCLGIVNPKANLNATFLTELGLNKPGSVALITQSGAMSLHITNALTTENVGISKLVSVGNRANLHFDEVVEYLAQDKETKVIALYIEGIERARQLMQVARRVVKKKPIIAYKCGRSQELDKASLSHTGALVGNYELYRAAFTQAGIIGVNDLTELVDVAKALAFQPPAFGNRVAVMSSGAGPGMVISDRCHRLGLRLAEFSAATYRSLRKLVPPLNPVDNPVDVAIAARYYDISMEMLKLVMEDEGVDMVDGATVVPTNQAKFLEALVSTSKCYKKPIVACLVYPLSEQDEKLLKMVDEGRVPVYPFPDRAVTGLWALWEYGKILKNTA